MSSTTETATSAVPALGSRIPGGKRLCIPGMFLSAAYSSSSFSSSISFEAKGPLFISSLPMPLQEPLRMPSVWPAASAVTADATSDYSTSPPL